jgi:hypothetical protein
VKAEKRIRLNKHSGPIGRLIWDFNLEKTKMETITPTQSAPRKPISFKIKVAKTREESIRNEKKDEAEFKVYVDGSGHDRGIGAAAVIYKKGQQQSLGHRKIYIGELTKHNTYKVKTAGAILATWLIDITLDTAGKNVTMYINNQSCSKW